jgi:Protein of unknown function (DUF559)
MVDPGWDRPTAGAAVVNPQLRRLPDDDSDGVITWAQARGGVPEHLLRYAARSAQLTRVFPRVWVEPAADGGADELRRVRAALASAGPGAALSHTSALWVWRLPVPVGGDVHVTTDPGRRIRIAGSRPTAAADLSLAPPMVVVRAGLPVTALDQTLVDAWPWLEADEQRAPLVEAVSERMTTTGRIRMVLDAVVNLPQRRALIILLDKLDAGCRSQLELWGHDQVFGGPEMRRLRWQVPVRLGGRTVWLDVFDPLTRTNFELDGSKYHSRPKDRERDLRRDAALATLGIQVVRFSHHRLTRDVAAVRHEVVAIMYAREGIGRPGAKTGPGIAPQRPMPR